MRKISVSLCFLSLGLACFVTGNAEPPIWDVMSDTWTAADDLGRTLPDASRAGEPKEGKFIGMFYFLWHGRERESGPHDVTKILAADPDAIQKDGSPPWGPKFDYHHWGESVFGYYVADDEAVLRKHAQMLADAQVDVIIFDVTNQQTYPESYRALCRVFDDMRKAGNRVPQIAFLTPFWKPDRVVRRLWDDFYSRNDYSELWFRWKGKPLLLANPEYIVFSEDFFAEATNHPVEATPGQRVGQSFVSSKNVSRVMIPVPTWTTKGSSATLSLYEEKPGGKRLASQRFDRIRDNSRLTLSCDPSLPPGKYYLELTHEKGRVGWWSASKSGLVPGGEGFRNGKTVPESRSIRTTGTADDETTERILEFFTFRTPQPDYFVGPTGPDQWSWLEIYPQHGFYNSENRPGDDGKPKRVEQVAVGTAQNAVDGKLGVLSNPRAHGRSFHDGKQPPPEECDFSGKNFDEQWRRAFQLDPEFVFVTGWNEWIMMRFPRDTPFHGSREQASNFVDQFNREFSRDLEPMRGGHGDTFYYQMIAMNRRFKGVREVETVRPQPITIDGRFDDWENVRPEFRDTIGDPVRRDHRAWGKELHYVNRSGLNDLVAAKISHDPEKKTLYFYVRTKDPIESLDRPERMRLYLDIDADPATGRLGYDFSVQAGVLLRHDDRNKDEHWETVRKIDASGDGHHYELSVPWESLGLKTLPAEIRFKWTDGIQATSWEHFTTDGDAAPNDRYNYRAVFSKFPSNEKGEHQ